MSLPTADIAPHRDFGGQRFVRHEAARASWRSWRGTLFENRDIGIGTATDGLAGVRVVRSGGETATPMWRHDGEFVFGFVLHGSMVLHCPGYDRFDLVEGDTFVVPAGMEHAWVDCSADLEVLDVTLPDQVAFYAS
jgi:quercetin dioxygenase-like cupin family protein